MPRACPVEFSRSLLHSSEREPPRDKPVASGRYYLSACYSSEREASTGQARGIRTVMFEVLGIAANVKASTGQARGIRTVMFEVLGIAANVKPPRDKPVASER
jgi:hypothetical protein